MRKRSERSLVFLFACFVFFCLLLHGGWRLIGTQGEEADQAKRPIAMARAALVGAPVRRVQTPCVQQHGQAAQRLDAVPAPHNHILNTRVLSDANGNVLAGRTYLRAVYQAFALGDGFV